VVRTIPALLALAIVCSAPGSASASSAAERLGEAWHAYEAGDFAAASKIAGAIDKGALLNDDYRLYVLAQSRALMGDCRRASQDFRRLMTARGSRFAAIAAWRLADCQWQSGELRSAQRSYRRLLEQAKKKRDVAGDTTLAEYRVAAAEAKAGAKKQAVRLLRSFVIEHPLHPLADEAAASLRALGDSAELSDRERIERAKGLTAAKKWQEAVAELERVDSKAPAALLRQRDYWLGMTLFRMRRQYARAGALLLGLYKDMGSDAARALFHGARALSRADRDKEAITWYQRVVAEYPRSSWAAEAQYLSGWLEFNMGNYREGLPHLERMLKLYPRSRYARLARWFLGMSHYFLGDYDKALPIFEHIGKEQGRLSGGKGRYWHARTLHKMGKKSAAATEDEDLVGRYPFSWYALLARSRLRELGKEVGPFGAAPRDPGAAPSIASAVPAELSRDPLLRRADELLRAGLGAHAAYEMRDGERAFVKRHGRDKGLAALLSTYRKAGNFNRPWMLSVVYGGSRALDAPPEKQARVWWEHAYPLAFQDLVEANRGLGKNPPYWLYSIMRKESGFDPNVHSYADARGLLQMIPATTERVVARIGLSYSEDLLFDPEANIKTGSWYIGHLFHKFREQVPMAAGSFNSGPRPVMRWLDQNKGREMDEWVELVSYTQTREYMKKVTETYARYLYLYGKTVYEQPLVVNSAYAKDALTY